MSEYNRLPEITRARAKARKRRKSPQQRRESQDVMWIGAPTEPPSKRS